APVLSFTAEEAWQAFPESLRGERTSVFDLTLLGHNQSAHATMQTWVMLKALRAQVASAQGFRDFETCAVVTAGGEMYDHLAALGDNLREALVVSEIELMRDDSDSSAARVMLPLQRAHGEKCARCWKYKTLGEDAAHALLCTPCAQIVNEMEAA
ncbi:MAG: hypothetical protein M3Z14_04800, partial [Candidatus Eremiobacteraeota bacterium]|nr:hypothetical protein [Candidatus Eremiobacteraeota bacterium]